MKATSVRIDETTIERIDGLASTLNRSRSWVVKQAIARFLEYEEWFVQEVQEGLKEVERGEVATPTQVKARFKKWGVDAR
ncbi:MAG: ribbon-helix-helix protein, CopG family [Desulfatitalea sp.]